MNYAKRVAINSPLVEGVFGNLGELASDVTTLAELQAKLAVADLKVSAGRATFPVALLVIGLGLFLGAIPVAFIGMAELLADGLGLVHKGWAYLIVAGIAVAVTVILTLIGWPALSRSFESLGRSRDELARNVAWIKSVITNAAKPMGRKQG